MESILYVDNKNWHEKEENAIVISPSHLNKADCFKSDYFDKVIIQNSKTDLLTGKAFFNICRSLKSGCTCEIILDQPISAMQQVEAKEIEANGKLGGFKEIQIDPYEYYIPAKEQQIKISTLKIIMTKE